MGMGEETEGKREIPLFRENTKERIKKSLGRQMGRCSGEVRGGH